MTIDAILNLILITRYGSPLQILAVSNVGYVFATCAALSAFVLLRRDRPDWPRPVRLPNWYVPLGAALAGFNFILLIFGGFIYSGGFLGIAGYGYGWDKTRAGLIVLLAAFVLYIWRHVVQDKIPVRLREEVPLTPQEEAAHPEFRVAPDAVPSA